MIEHPLTIFKIDRSICSFEIDATYPPYLYLGIRRYLLQIASVILRHRQLQGPRPRPNTWDVAGPQPHFLPEFVVVDD